MEIINFINNENLSLYFYSAIFQGNMALLAFLGVFVVFKMQTIMNDKYNKETALVKFVQKYFEIGFGSVKDNSQWFLETGYPEIYYPDVKNLNELIKKLTYHQSFSLEMRSRITWLYHLPFYKNKLSDLEMLNQSNEYVRKGFKLSAYLLSFIIIIALILLIYSSCIHKVYPSYELYFLGSVALTNIVALIITVKFIFKVIK
jgi:hypothetical protein